ncbi:hypothetical protein SAMN04487895_11470 [Paenibacillus sophorae]|uniref:Uncharacterized protein n=1 Tax=Paenibacillus sophorae TaxID=1333845 RepID=A0A1H8TIQ0_9BACL|nr:hypothetical protein [Paenibacillus sophorae]QWU16228.1 hypothetical protein KP014_02855 [Paenibacillus sophorae]SEO90681.1 hypothetical protein SAMN04487895_11470 [Paenibacillus sophorae]
MEEMQQREYDEVIKKIEKNYKAVTLSEYKKLVGFMQTRYHGYDQILSALPKEQLWHNYDYFGRSYCEAVQHRQRWGLSSKHYILSCLLKASQGLTSESRRRIFSEERMTIFQDNIGFGHRTGFAQIKFFVEKDTPYLFLVHEYGFNSITNKIEDLVTTVEAEYLLDTGFSVIEDKVQIYYKDVGDSYNQVNLEVGLVHPKWRTLEPQERLWFDHTWDSLGNETKDQQPSAFFFEKGKQFDAYNTIMNIFTNVKKELFIVDNYIDSTLFLMLEKVNPGARIRLLTSKLQGDAPVAIEKFRDQRGNFEWCQAKDFHDRYIFADNDGYLLGASIKDFADKATTLVTIQEKQVVKLIKSYAMDKFKTAILNKSLIQSP